jgi:cell division protease FtsH
MDEETRKFAETFSRFVETMSRAAQLDKSSEVRTLLTEHLGVDPASQPVVSAGFPAYDHVNLQLAMSAYLQSEGRQHGLVGISGQQRHFGSLSDIIEMSNYAHVRLGSVDYVTLPIGPSETLVCVNFGLFLVADGDYKLVVLLRGPSEHGQQQGASLEALSTDQERAHQFLGEIASLMVQLNVFRGQVISFGSSAMGHMGLGPVVFHERPKLDRESLVLPESTLDLIERQVTGIARQKDRLRGAGQHVKRGLLLYGPPGCGKTLTLRYLISRATEHTVVILSGGGLYMIRHAGALARLLQPSIVILEDVDLVAQERVAMPGFSNTVLFDLLNEMDGIEEDADVAFILTSNRADLLEPALAARPGRVDLAVEIGLPDEEARSRLIALYARGVELELRDPAPLIASTRGVAASFIKELVRKASLISAEQSDGKGTLTLSDEHLLEALSELLDERSAVTRTLLGASPEEAQGKPGTQWLTTPPGTQ